MSINLHVHCTGAFTCTLYMYRVGVLIRVHYQPVVEKTIPAEHYTDISHVYVRERIRMSKVLVGNIVKH